MCAYGGEGLIHLSFIAFNILNLAFLLNFKQYYRTFLNKEDEYPQSG